MKKILVVSDNQKIKEAIETVKKKYASFFNFEFCINTEDAIETVYYEIPEIKIIDFTSPNIKWSTLLQTIGSDPWLHNGGIIAIAKDTAQIKIIEDLKNSNILFIQAIDQFPLYVSNLLHILLQNQQFLFSRGMQEHFVGIESGSFVSKNDAVDIQVYASFLVNYLYSSNRIDAETRYRLSTTLMELLYNALEHGNCGISYSEKTAWLEQGKSMLDLIALKNQNPEIAKKRIHIDYSMGKTSSTFTVRDDGNGFDWKARVNKPINPGLHGMGISLSESFTKELRYNDKGNEVTFSVPNTVNSVNTVPSIFSAYSITEYTDKDIVCKQNELSNNIFFIVSGRYAVYVNRKLISVLTPNDMFIGEMSFLLNNRRSAAILCVGKGQLIKISKTAFLDLIRKNPHYALFLAKLLAQRLYKQTHKIAEHK
ncbi:MAG: cyclic nucleotide-binding domain-containing protein [Spirochaetales bacterium]